MQWKKMIAPMLVTVLMLLYYILYFFLIVRFLDGFLALAFGMIPLLLGGGIIYACLQRMKEIRSGEEDDLSKY